MIDLTPRRHFCLTVPPSRAFLASLLTAALGFFSAAPARAQLDQASRPEQQSEPSKPVRPIHIVPFVTHPGEQNGPQTSAHLNYYGGPVVSNVQVVVVYWGANVNSEIIANIPGFYQGVTDSVYFDLLSEYSTDVTPVGGGSGTNQSIGRGSFVQATMITPTIGDCPPTCNLSDSEIQTELIGQINAGHLPGPQYDSAGNDLTEYAIYFPSGANITDPGGDQSCVRFCAYHNTGTFNSKDLAYGIFPDLFTGACTSGCGTAPNAFDNLTSVSSHELAETVTDVAVGLAPSLVPPLAWYDPQNGEIGDICNQEQVSVSTPQGSYMVQKLWSNAEAVCLVAGLHPSYQLSAPGSANAGASFGFTLTALNPAGSKGTDTAYAGTVHFISSDNANGVVLPADFTFTSSNQGTAMFSATLQTTGSQTITATDTVNGAITATASINVTVNPTPTSTAVMTSVNPSTFGQSVTFTATVTPTSGGTPTGTVTFTADGSNVLGAISLSGGQAALSTTSLGVGSHSIVASYSGDSAHLASSSTALSQTVMVASTTTSLASSANPAVVGQTITYTATVTSQYFGIATGSVIFKAGATALGSGTLVNGQASVNTSFSTSGTRSITATYVGDANNAGSKSLTLQQLVNKAPSSTALVSDNNPSGYGQMVTFTATVTCAASPTKTVTFKYGGTVLGKVSLTGNTASLSTSALGAGTDAITAVYSGDVNCAGSTSPVLEQVVNIAPTTETLMSSQNPSAVGQPVTFTATVSSSAGVPTGKVKFTRGSSPLGTVTLSGGVAALTTSKLPAGSDPITATYLGTVNYSPNSASLTQVVE